MGSLNYHCVMWKIVSVICQLSLTGLKLHTQFTVIGQSFASLFLQKPTLPNVFSILHLPFRTHTVGKFPALCKSFLCLLNLLTYFLPYLFTFLLTYLLPQGCKTLTQSISLRKVLESPTLKLFKSRFSAHVLICLTMSDLATTASEANDGTVE